MKTGFGWIHAKPATSFSPVAVTPDELGAAWRDGSVHLPMRVAWNGREFGHPHAGDMGFGFHELIAHAAYSRNLSAGTIIGSGTISNDDYATVGSACIAERRAIEIEADAAHAVTELHALRRPRAHRDARCERQHHFRRDRSAHGRRETANSAADARRAASAITTSDASRDQCGQGEQRHDRRLRDAGTQPEPISTGAITVPMRPTLFAQPMPIARSDLGIEARQHDVDATVRAEDEEPAGPEQN